MRQHSCPPHNAASLQLKRICTASCVANLQHAESDYHIWSVIFFKSVFEVKQSDSDHVLSTLGKHNTNECWRRFEQVHMAQCMGAALAHITS